MTELVLPQKRLSSSEISTRKKVCELESTGDHLESKNLLIKTFQEIKLMRINCFQLNCIRDVVFKCLDDGVLTCGLHADIHCEEDGTKAHNLRFLKSDFNNEKRDKLVNYIRSYNSGLKNLKQKIAFQVSKHFRKINKEMGLLFQNIETMISQNKLKMLGLGGESLKMFENITLLSQFIESDFKTEFTKECHPLEISVDCLNIIKTEIYNWNLTQDCHKIGEIANKEYKVDKESLGIIKREESLEIDENSIVLNDKKCKKLLHRCEWETDKVHYFDFKENKEKSVTITDLKTPKLSRSISIDDNNILLCGGVPDNLPDTNENSSKVYKVNIETQSLINLASMNIGRSDFCMTYLNGFYYVLGGMDYKNEKVNKCERYTLGNNRWKYIANLRNPRSAATCVSVNKQSCIYVIGGLVNSLKYHRSIEKYNSENNLWTVIMYKWKIFNQVLGSCWLPDSNMIIVFGGSDSNDSNNKESYLYNYESNELTTLKPMTTIINDIVNEPIIFDEKIYCYFGESDSEMQLSIYDIKSEVWSIKS